MRAAARLLAALSLLIFVPPLVPIFGAMFEPSSRLINEFGRWSELFLTTLSLVGLTWAMSLPAGVWLGFRVGRMGRGRGFALGILLALALIPVPVHVAAWQAVLTPGGAMSDLGGWRPFASGLVGRRDPEPPWPRYPSRPCAVASCVMRISPEVEAHARTVGGPRLRVAAGLRAVFATRASVGRSWRRPFRPAGTARSPISACCGRPPRKCTPRSSSTKGLAGAVWASPCPRRS